MIELLHETVVLVKENVVVIRLCSCGIVWSSKAALRTLVLVNDLYISIDICLLIIKLIHLSLQIVLDLSPHLMLYLTFDAHSMPTAVLRGRLECSICLDRGMLVGLVD